MGRRREPVRIHRRRNCRGGWDRGHGRQRAGAGEDARALFRPGPSCATAPAGNRTPAT